MELTGFGITRERAVELLNTHISNENLRRHCLATEAIMRRLAERLGEDPDLWGLTGLLHDLDLELVNNDMSVHGRKTYEMLFQPRAFARWRGTPSCATTPRAWGFPGNPGSTMRWRQRKRSPG